LTEINPLSWLKVDAWFKVLIAIGGVAFIISPVLPVQTITNRQLMFFGLGFLFIGLGEWKSHGWQMAFQPASFYNNAAWIKTYVRYNSVIGYLLIGLGFIALALAFADLTGLFAFL
jgi:hypothetical protein